MALQEAPPRAIEPERATDQIDRLYGLALSLCGSPHLAEELVQETYVRLLTRPRRLRGPDDFPYLARILRNLLYDHYRRSKRIEWTELVVDGEEPVDDREEGDPEAAARANELYGLVAGLPPEQRDVVAAVDVAGMRYQEAARALGVPIGTVMSRLSRGRSRLARTLVPG
ncbi:MAG TPA: RNA polymerase sigma factor [Thermoleophilaceae bacterium]|jgi:RNA polymerase sigma-70 factor (ECF subfamily)